MKRAAIVITLLIVFNSCAKQNAGLAQNNTTDIIKGFDISYLPDIRKQQATVYNSNGLAEDMLQTLKKAGVNTVRIRLWYNPSEKISDLATVTQLSNECKALGFKVLLTVHYSDSWADPTKQIKPLQWQHLPFTVLVDSVYNYTQKIVQQINPTYIQIGNEINLGILWPDGNNSNHAQMVTLLTTASKAIRATNKATTIVVQYAGHTDALSFLQSINAVEYDMVGLSYYPFWHGNSLTELEQNITNIATSLQKPIFIAETSYPFTLQWNDHTNNIIGLPNQILPAFQPTPEGQKQFLQAIKKITTSNSLLKGFCYWGGEWIAYKGNTATNGSTWENQALWDFSNKVLPALEVFK